MTTAFSKETVLSDDRLTDEGKKRVLEFMEEVSSPIPESFFCPECECRRDVELYINLSKISGDNGATWEQCQSFYFRCPKCWFDLGGGTLLETDVNRVEKMSDDFKFVCGQCGAENSINMETVKLNASRPQVVLTCNYCFAVREIYFDSITCPKCKGLL